MAKVEILTNEGKTICLEPDRNSSDEKRLNLDHLLDDGWPDIQPGEKPPGKVHPKFGG